MAVHYLSQSYGEDGPPREFALDMLKRAPQDGNRGVREVAAWSLLFGPLKPRPDVQAREIVPLLIPLLSEYQSECINTGCKPRHRRGRKPGGT